MFSDLGCCASLAGPHSITRRLSGPPPPARMVVNLVALGLVNPAVAPGGRGGGLRRAAPTLGPMERQVFEDFGKRVKIGDVQAYEERRPLFPKTPGESGGRGWVGDRTPGEGDPDRWPWIWISAGSAEIFF